MVRTKQTAGLVEKENVLSLVFSVLGIPRARMAFEVADRFFSFGLALVFENSGHPFLPIKRHADLPRPREDFWILDGDFILNGIGVKHRVPLGQPKRIAMKI